MKTSSFNIPGSGPATVRALTTALCLLVSMGAGAQQKAGEVQHLQGMATAQQAGGTMRFLVKGDTVLAGDTLTTTDKGFAVLALGDGSKITLRPATTFAVESFAYETAQDGAVLRLLRGGMRAVTGLINRRNPGSVQIRTSTATIGIRGTSFDARICGDDCRQEENALAGRPNPPQPVPPADSVVARVVRLKGEASAVQAGKPARKLQEGAPLYTGDEVRTSNDATAVLGFRDQSKLSLNPDTAFRITGFSYNRPKEPDSFAAYLLRGGLRVFTGLIGKGDPKAMSLSTRLSTIGIRGTGMDISCDGPCAEPPVTMPVSPVPARTDGLFMVTWLGQTYFSGSCGDLDVNTGAGGFVGADCAARTLAAIPDFMLAFEAPRPDEVEVDWTKLFGATASTGADGLYVFVRDGAVSLITGLGQTDLGVGETGYAGADGQSRRLNPVPRFMSDDPFPIPEFFSQSERRILQLFGATLGQPGQEICRL